VVILSAIRFCKLFARSSACLIRAGLKCGCWCGEGAIDMAYGNQPTTAQSDLRSVFTVRWQAGPSQIICSTRRRAARRPSCLPHAGGGESFAEEYSLSHFCLVEVISWQETGVTRRLLFAVPARPA
jgi:hypothetical protein